MCVYGCTCTLCLSLCHGGGVRHILIARLHFSPCSKGLWLAGLLRLAALPRTAPSSSPPSLAPRYEMRARVCVCILPALFRFLLSLAVRFSRKTKFASAASLCSDGTTARTLRVQVPKFTVVIGGSFGAGNYGMCGRAYDPRCVVLMCVYVCVYVCACVRVCVFCLLCVMCLPLPLQLTNSLTS